MDDIEQARDNVIQSTIDYLDNKIDIDTLNSAVSDYKKLRPNIKNFLDELINFLYEVENYVGAQYNNGALMKRTIMMTNKALDIRRKELDGTYS